MLFRVEVRQAEIEFTPSAFRPRVKKRFITRDREAGHDRLDKDYFAEDLVYNEHQFCRRFRMRRHLFLRIVEALRNHSKYFQVRCDATRMHALTPLTKYTATMKMLAYSIMTDCVDEYLKIGASTTLECMKNFALGVIEVFGMLESIGCMH